VLQVDGEEMANPRSDRERTVIRGRGAAANPPNRFDRFVVEEDADALDPEASARASRTTYYRDASKSVIATNDSPDVGFDASVNPYRGCTHGCSYCLGPDTPVLFADWIWRPIGEVEVGDELVGFDEWPEPGRTRKVRIARVTDVWWSRQPTVRIAGRSGEVIATAGHRWLEHQASRWTCTHRLGLGAVLARIERIPAPVGAEMKLEPEPLDAVEPRGIGDVVDLTTTTGTFFAAGLATHNCFARPTHEYLGFSAGLDFETKIMVKDDAPALLRQELASPRWKPKPLGLSGVTDPYQPIERKLRITRGCLEVLAEARNPVVVITKNHLVTRDVELLAELARHDAAAVCVSVTTLRAELQQVLEPRASPPSQRLRAIEALASAGVPVGVLVAPVIPALTDEEIPAILAAVASAGARFAGKVTLRLPWAVKDVFVRWLDDHLPERKEKILARVLDLRGGRLNDPGFGSRMRGAGKFADEIEALFRLGCRRSGIPDARPVLSTAGFRRPQGAQLPLL
jgi:DNA repair photolyase